MSILSLSNELLLQISTYLNRQDDLWSLSLVSRRFHYDIYDDCLYRFNITYRECSALFWAALNGQFPTVNKILDLLPTNMNINTTLTKQTLYHHPTMPFYFSKRTKNALYYSNRNGHLRIVDLLLQRKANPVVREDHGASLLYAALLSGNDLVIEKIVPMIPDLKDHIAVTSNGYTPLHVACRFGRVRWVRHFLEKGVDVEKTDSKGWTALRHVLELDFEHFWDRGWDWDQERDSRVDRVPLTAVQVRDVVRVLVEYGADPFVKREERWDWVRREWGVAVSTAVVVGRGHLDREVRKLFQGASEDGFTLYELEYLEGRFHPRRFKDGSRIGPITTDDADHSSSMIAGDRRPYHIVQSTPNTLIPSLRPSRMYLDLRPHQPTPIFTDYMTLEDPGKAWLAAASENSLARYSNSKSRRKTENQSLHIASRTYLDNGNISDI